MRYSNEYKEKSKSAALVMCLQETYVMNKFALNNIFRGSIVTDECSSVQLGTVILVDNSLEVVTQLVTNQDKQHHSSILSIVNDLVTYSP